MQDTVQRTEADFGERVRAYRLRKNISQRELADKLNLDGSAISRLEQGARAIRLGEAAVIAEVLEVSLPELIRGESERDPAVHLEDLRRAGLDRLERAREAASLAADNYVVQVGVLSEHPDLLQQIAFRGSQRPPQTMEEFLIQSRRDFEDRHPGPEGLTMGPDWVPPITPAERALIVEILQAAVANLISTEQDDNATEA